MAYRSLRFDTPAADADAWTDALLDAGALSVDASDTRAGTSEEAPRYGEPGEPDAGWWPVTRLAALFADGADPEAALRAAATAVGQAVPDHALSDVAEQDWVRATQSQFAPIAVAPRLWIVPTWCEPPDPSARNVRLDPGLAFGTGSHPTTLLCLRWLAATVRPGDSLLDYGCGSGVLAIAAAMLGASPVAGVDVDPQAIAASVANAHANRVDATFGPPEGIPPGPYDVVLANILAAPLILLAPAIAARAGPHARLALSGILESQADAVLASYARWFNIAATERSEGWVLLTGERRPGA